MSATKKLKVRLYLKQEAPLHKLSMLGEIMTFPKQRPCNCPQHSTVFLCSYKFFHMMGPQPFSEADVARESCLKKQCSLEGGELIVVLRLYLMFGSRCTSVSNC